MTKRYQRLELLVSGYIHEQEYELDSSIIPDGIIKIVFNFYPKLIPFGAYNKDQFTISNDNTVIIGKGNCGGYMIYADTSENNGKGYKKGIHAWSVIALPTEYNINNPPNTDGDNTGFSECFQSIGVTTAYNTTIHSGHFPTEPHQAIASDFFQGHRGNWKHHETITIILNCHDWNVTYFKDAEQIQQEPITPHISYYFALSCCGTATWTKVQTVETPHQLL